MNDMEMMFMYIAISEIVENISENITIHQLVPSFDVHKKRR